jgi:hypothetical protein
MKAPVLKKLKVNFLQSVLAHAIGRFVGTAVQSLNPRHSAVDDASEFSAKFRRAGFEQTLFRFFGGKPGGVSIRFLRRFEAGHLAKVGSDGKLRLSRWGSGRARIPGKSCTVRVAAKVAGEGDFFHPAMNPSLFKSLEGSGLGVSEAGFDAAFGKNPTSTTGLHQQEFDATSADAVAHGGDLLASLRKP